MNNIDKTYNALRGGDLVVYVQGWNRDLYRGILISLTWEGEVVIGAKILSEYGYTDFLRLRHSAKRIYKMYKQDLLNPENIISLHTKIKIHKKEITEYNKRFPKNPRTVKVKEKKLTFL